MIEDTTDTNVDEEIQALINVNELQIESESLNSVEWGHNSENWSFYPFKPICQIDWDKSVASEVEKIAEDNPYVIKSPGEISAAESLTHKQGSYGLDTRPKIYDKASKKWTLLDSGSCVSCESLVTSWTNLSN